MPAGPADARILPGHSILAAGLMLTAPGGDAGRAATPAYVIDGVAIVGHPGLKALQGVIRSVRACGKVVC